MAWTEATSRMAPVHLSGTFLISCPKVPPRSRSFHGACSPGHLKELPKGPIKKLISATKAGINCHPIMRAIAPERSSSLPSAHSWELLLVHFSYLLWNELGYAILVEFLLKLFFYVSVIALVYFLLFASPERTREFLDFVQATYHRALQQAHLEASNRRNQISNMLRNRD